ncbi:folate-binding protein YgfZ [Methylosoma difficile]
MNSDWQEFLTTQQADFSEDGVTFPTLPSTGQAAICPIAHLSVLKVMGSDAGKLLQGQITCNVNDIGESQSSLGALCNPKGRAIAVFLLMRDGGQFLLVLPTTQLAVVKNHLQKYVLRADVKLVDASQDYCVMGEFKGHGLKQTLFVTQRDPINIAFFNRNLLLVRADQAIAWWSARREQGFQAQASVAWQIADIEDGIPWLCPASAEEHVPQMFNLDRLGGISFNKGCYTGQEIIARSHYLGKVKRSLALAECVGQQAPEINSEIMDGNGQAVGQVLAAQNQQGLCKLLLVLQQDEAGDRQYRLPDQTPLTLLALHYD